MKNSKRIAASVLSIILAASLIAGCGSAKKNDETYESVVNQINEQIESSTESKWGSRNQSNLDISSVNGKSAETESEEKTDSPATGKPDASGLYQVEYVRTIDGDTLEVKNGNDKFRVRLIGVDTPESVHPDESKNTDLGVAASTYTKTLLENTTKLYLQYGTDPEDNYNRKLCYVWLRNDVDKDDESDVENYMLNARLCKAGMAVSLTVPPNIDYAPIFIRLVKQARENSEGLWQTDDGKSMDDIWVDDYENYENGQVPKANTSTDEELDMIDTL